TIASREDNAERQISSFEWQELPIEGVKSERQGSREGRLKIAGSSGRWFDETKQKDPVFEPSQNLDEPFCE
ncbi:hypothetical protein NPIL_455361, partial [Nephila pilipes]